MPPVSHPFKRGAMVVLMLLEQWENARQHRPVAIVG
jgi:hypothetical protein